MLGGTAAVFHFDSNVVGSRLHVSCFTPLRSHHGWHSLTVHTSD